MDDNQQTISASHPACSGEDETMRLRGLDSTLCKHINTSAPTPINHFDLSSDKTNKLCRFVNAELFYTVSQKNVTLFISFFVKFHPILLIFGRNMRQEI